MAGLGLPTQKQYPQLPVSQLTNRVEASSSSTDKNVSAFVLSIFSECDDTFEAYHLVSGRQRKGFIIDPGAASGICGTDTLLQHNGKDTQNYTITPGSGNFTGINGRPTTGLGHVAQKAQRSRVELSIDSDPSDVHVVSVLLTYSNHYLLLTNDPAGQQREEPAVSAQVVEMLMHMVYMEDTFPDYLTSENVAWLKQRYKDTPKEFYTETGYEVVAPTNFDKSRLTVLFPVGYRYGWDLMNPEHRKMLSKVQAVFKPIVKLSAPDCRMWTAMSNKRGAGVAAAERQAEFPKLERLHRDNVVQDRDRHGYINQNDLRSQLWTQSPLKQNQDIASNRTRRVDGCAQGCVIQLRKTIRRCPGHGVQRHAMIEGSAPGSGSKTVALTTVYTRTMCRALISNIASFARKSTCALMFAALVRTQKQCEFSYYTLRRRHLGSAATVRRHTTSLRSQTAFLNLDNGVDFIALLPAGTAGQLWPRSGLALRQCLGINGGVIDADYRGELIVILENRGKSRFACQSGDRIAQLMIVQSHTPPVQLEDHIDDGETGRGKNGFGSTGLHAQQMAWKLQAGTQGRSQADFDTTSGQDTFSDGKGYDGSSMKVAYDRLRRVKVGDFTTNIHEQLKNIDQLWMARILADLAGQHTGILTAPNTQQQLNVGDDADGIVQILIELLRPLMDVDSLHITFQPNSLETSNTTSIDDSPFRIVSLGADIDKWESPALERLDGLTPAQQHHGIRDHKWLIAAQGHAPPPTMEEDAERRILPRLKLTTAPPSFDFAKLRQQLQETEYDAARFRLLKGLHERLWHEQFPSMEKFLRRLGVPDRCLELAQQVLAACEQCNDWPPIASKPKYRAELAGWFGDFMACDLFFIFGKTFLLMVGEAIGWNIAQVLPKDAFHIAQAMLRTWFRYFGPPKCIKFDQEGGVRSDDFAPTITGLAEKRSLIKTSALECKASVAKQRLAVPDEDIMFERTMCQNCMLEYGGCTPSQCLHGQNPRGFFDHGSNSTLSIDGARDSTPNTLKSCLRLRMMAQTAFQKAVIEQRIAEANNTRVQIRSDVAKLRHLQDFVDLYRVPDRKDAPGWKAAPAVTITVGMVHDANGMQTVVPDDLEVDTPEVFRLASQVGEVLLQVSAPRAIRFGTQLPNIDTYHGIKRGVILAWIRRDRLIYQVRQVDLGNTLRLATILPDTPSNYYFIIYVSDQYEEVTVQDALPDLPDISSIEQIDDAPWTAPTQFLPSPPPTEWWKPPGQAHLSWRHLHLLDLLMIVQVDQCQKVSKSELWRQITTSKCRMRSSFREVRHHVELPPHLGLQHRFGRYPRYRCFQHLRLQLHRTGSKWRFPTHLSAWTPLAENQQHLGSHQLYQTQELGNMMATDLGPRHQS
ncbi:unnamed protein product [Prorocentrum cordatum]|uniref:dUTP diphosphatase n=1 Tax=Prorocentrum cordatum TaxID=2364126 RepID=A0ABN9UD52_9DINO|nr:unnamed protein product [Polarella glacialis]